MDREGTGERSGRVKFMAGLARFASYTCVGVGGVFIGNQGADAGWVPIFWFWGTAILAGLATVLTEHAAAKTIQGRIDEARRQIH